jgi:hypothetical protein
VNADAAGAWTFDYTGQSLAPGTYNFTATTIDRTGNLSTSSATFRVIIDTTAPNLVTTPTLDLADDTGVQGDRITNRRQPRLVGTTEANATVTIVNPLDVLCTGTPLGTGSAAANGNYTTQFANPLADGQYTVRVCSSDAAGNATVSGEFTFTVDGTPPRIENFAPAPGSVLQISTSQLVVTFNKDALNTTLAGDPSFAGSVNNRQNFRLQASGGDGVFGNGNDPAPLDLTNSDFIYDRTDLLVDRLTINIRGATGQLAPLANDTWRFTINGTTSLQDIAGNRIDGEFPAAGSATCLPQPRPTGFPTGNCVDGGDFIPTFQVAVPPPTIDPIVTIGGVVTPTIQLTGTRKVVTRATVQFTRPLDVTSARNPNNYSIRGAGRDRVFGTIDDAVVQLATPAYDPATNDRLVTLTALRGFATNALFQLIVNDGITDPGGNRLDGNRDGVPGGRFVAFIGRGTNLNMVDGDGTAANITTGRGRSALVDVVLGSQPSGNAISDGRTIRVDPTTVTAPSALTGRVSGGNGRIKFDAIVGANTINRTGFPICTTAASTGCFEISSVSAVIDQVLENGEQAIDGLFTRQAAEPPEDAASDSTADPLGHGLAGIIEQMRSHRR